MKGTQGENVNRRVVTAEHADSAPAATGVVEVYEC